MKGRKPPKLQVNVHKMYGGSPLKEGRIDLHQYEVRIDGRREGYVTDNDGSTILLHNLTRRFSNAELLEIRKEVALQLHPQIVAGIRQLPPPPDRPELATSGDL